MKLLPRISRWSRGSPNYSTQLSFGNTMTMPPDRVRVCAEEMERMLEEDGNSESSASNMVVTSIQHFKW